MDSCLRATSPSLTRRRERSRGHPGVAGAWRRRQSTHWSRPAVTRNICREVGLPVERVVLGSEVDAMSTPNWPEKPRMSQSWRKLSPRRRRASSRRCTCADTWWAFSATASMTGRRSRPRTSASRSIPPSTSQRNRRTSSCWSRTCWCSSKASSRDAACSAASPEYIKMGAELNFGNMFSVLGASAFSVPADAPCRFWSAICFMTSSQTDGRDGHGG